ncbi:Holliday junction resolvase RuvX [Thiofilum flexile]|uniref:Holliday junction resolvase RuvX n=1 Tax=Thiofilum flexile TaxID=125627 RepID=UPI00035D6FCF|nr:Holliday junction resolvase RuvX [Thiofilum flexile]
MMIVLGFDYGKNRTGVALANTLTGLATPLGILYAQKGEPDWIGIQNHIETWKPSLLVVGMPQKLDGSDSAMKEAILLFAKRLERKTQLPVQLANEQLTSQEANQRLISARQAGRKRKIRKEEIDQLAAAIILENWMLETSYGQNV